MRYLVLLNGIGLALLMAGAPSSNAQDFKKTTAKDLADFCTTAVAVEDGSAEQKYRDDEISKRAMDTGYCLGFISGIVGGYSAGNQGRTGKFFCLPEGVNSFQIARVLVKAMEKAPELEHESPLVLALGGLKGAFPCTDSTQSEG